MMATADNHVPPWEPSPEIFLKGKGKGKKRQGKEVRQRQQNLTSASASATKAKNHPIKNSLSLQGDDHLLVENYHPLTSRENVSSCKTTTISASSIPDRGGTRDERGPPFTGNPDAEKKIYCNKKKSQNNDTYYAGQPAACEQCFEEGKQAAIPRHRDRTHSYLKT